MARWLHRAAALVAAYAIALQAILAGVAPVAGATLQAAGVLCTGATAPDHGPPLRHDPACPACSFLCGGAPAPALAPTAAVVSPAVIPPTAARRATPVPVPPDASRHRLPPSRAPPSAA